MIELPPETKLNTFNKFFLDHLKAEINQLIEVSLIEDLDKIGDVTSNAIIKNEKQGLANVIAKQDGVFSGGFLVKMVYSYIDQKVNVDLNETEGTSIKNRQIVIKIKGRCDII